MFRFLAAPAGALSALAMFVPNAGAVEFFATTDQTKITAADTCASEATACALSKALATAQAVKLELDPFGAKTITLLPGRYDVDDVDAGVVFPSGRLSVPFGAIVRGQPGAARPTIALSDPGSSSTAVEVRGGVLRDLNIECTSFGCVRLQGAQASGPISAVPALIERVRIVSDPAPNKQEAYGLSLSMLSTAANVDVHHRAQEGDAVGMTTDGAAPDESPKLIGSTVTSDTGTALSVTGGIFGKPDLEQAIIIDSVVRGKLDLSAQSDAFNIAPPAGFQPNPIKVTLSRTTVRPGAARTLLGPVTVAEDGTIAAADLGLGADRVPAAGSPLIDAGIADAALGTTDLLGNARVVGSAPDIGAYEAQAVKPTTTPQSGGGGAPATQSPTETKRPAVDLTPPTLNFGTVKRLARTKLLGKKGLTVAPSSSEAVQSAKLELLTQKKGKGAKVLEKILITAEVKATPAGPLTFVLKGKAGRLGKGSLKAKLRLTAIDAAGNIAKLERDVTIR